METARGPVEKPEQSSTSTVSQCSDTMEEEKAMAKAKGQRFTEKKPALGKLQGAILRPKLNICEDEDGQSASGEEFDLNNVSDDSGEE
jgi:hypothetical protein